MELLRTFHFHQVEKHLENGVIETVFQRSLAKPIIFQDAIH
jgi:hypothetical protein